MGQQMIGGHALEGYLAPIGAHRLHSRSERGLDRVEILRDTVSDSNGGVMKISLRQLSDISDVPERSIRFYIQKDLLPHPKGEKRGAYYSEDHLSQLLRIRQWREAGLSLDAIGDLLQAKREAPISPIRPGSMEVRSHLIVADGLELMVAPERAGLSQTQLRRLFQAVQAAYADLADENNSAEPITDRNPLP